MCIFFIIFDILYVLFVLYLGSFACHSNIFLCAYLALQLINAAVRFLFVLGSVFRILSVVLLVQYAIFMFLCLATFVTVFILLREYVNNVHFVFWWLVF
jgi:hypothetical protein